MELVITLELVEEEGVELVVTLELVGEEGVELVVTLVEIVVMVELQDVVTICASKGSNRYASGGSIS